MRSAIFVFLALIFVGAAFGLSASESDHSDSAILSVHSYIDDSGQVHTLTVSESHGDKGAVWFSGDSGYGVDVCDKGPYICLGDEFAVPGNLRSKLAAAGHEKDYRQAEIDTQWEFKGLFYYVEPMAGFPPIKYRWVRHIGLLGTEINAYLIVAWNKPMILGFRGFAPQVAQFLWSPQRGLVMISSKQTDFKIGGKKHSLILPSFYDLVLMSRCGFGAPPSCVNHESVKKGKSVKSESHGSRI